MRLESIASISRNLFVESGFNFISYLDR